MEKHAAIEHGTTPPEDQDEGVKTAAEDMPLEQLEKDPTKRMADHATGCCGGACHEKPETD
jgi:hypothetical protein